MQQIIKELNENVGILGSMVITDDGMVVAQSLGPDLKGEVVAAIASNVIRGTKRALGQLGAEDIDKYQMNSKHGRMMFVNLGNAFLVVVTNQNIDISNTLLEIESAVYKITHRRAN